MLTCQQVQQRGPQAVQVGSRHGRPAELLRRHEAVRADHGGAHAKAVPCRRRLHPPKVHQEHPAPRFAALQHYVVRLHIPAALKPVNMACTRFSNFECTGAVRKQGVLHAGRSTFHTEPQSTHVISSPL